ncbi:MULTISPECIES: peptide MFS transporter [unclassified Sphingopyxis]|uniref:peptide MFS transporter n=1 Tax=unclassified Sphingopyxis TaxID=2614943 RepID=UPI0007305195|nr:MULTISPECIES: peptide MFS transporter [unclassified Sphingopyxis]KTE24484.1 MFS transporter [Sphingopyxis sp. H057]KTE49462.1 MFS transporter [Sphingopyxis sp. H071]KTE52155.1 MFS transporter [Sphingopyxis sp. H073]KTE60512.1 MFS transporter [Sphingopyxis sp. H107]KTE63899.1 MFS transporter [Sphingopyxis sp. H100]
MKSMGMWDEGDWIAVIALVVLAVFLSIGALIAGSKKPEFAGHPKGLYMLFFAEMWERFSYYGMRAILIFYLTQHWLFSDSKSNLIYGAYTSLVYITPVLGGYLADRYLGQRKAVLFGGLLLAAGHSLMAVEGGGGQEDATINVFWAALAFIIVGSGFLKANISVMVGQLYRLTDVRRDGAYTIFYMGINVGAALGTILVGYLGQRIGWGYGFGLAGIGMLAGLVVFVLGKSALLGAGEAPAPLAKSREWTLYGIGFAAVAVIWALVQYQDVIQSLLAVSGIALLGYVLYESFKLEKEPRERMFAILFLIALNPLFWGLFEQAGGSMNLFTDRYVDRGAVPASIFQSINPIYIILFAPFFAGLWQWLGKRGMEPSAPAKFGMALAQMGLANLVLVWGAEAFGVAAMTPVLFVFLYYLLATTGELCLSPVGLSAMNRLAPSYLASLIMGAWFYMTAVGNFVAGKIGEATGGHGGEMSKAKLLEIYEMFGWIAIGAAVAVLLVSPIVKRWMHLDTLRDRDEGLAGVGEAEPQAAGIHPEPKGA